MKTKKKPKKFNQHKEEQELLKSFEPLYLGIYRIRMLIEMHSAIAKVSSRLLDQNFWGCLQGNLIVGAVIVELFSILDHCPARKSILNQLNENEGTKFKCILDELLKGASVYNGIRNALCHADEYERHGHTVDYEMVLDILNRLEQELDNIICDRYDSYCLLSTKQTLNGNNLASPAIIRQTSSEKVKYYYFHDRRCGFIELENTELYDEVNFPDFESPEQTASSLLPEKTLNNINNVRLNWSMIKPQTKPNATYLPTIVELNKILDMEIKARYV